MKARHVGGKACPWETVSAECPLINFSVSRSAPRATPVFNEDYFFRCSSDEEFYNVLICEEICALHRIIGMEVIGVFFVRNSSCSTLCANGMRSQRMMLRNNGYVQFAVNFSRCDSSP